MPNVVQSPPVLVVRGVTKRLHAGIRGCRATARVLVDVDLVMRHGDRVALVDAGCGGAGWSARTLLHVAAGIARPDAGAVWRSPGARLTWVDRVAPGAVRGVAERAVAVRSAGPIEMLCWPDDAAALLVAGTLLDARLLRAGRIAVLRAGALHLLHDGVSSCRVDSALGAT
jgi:hypothetical protein